MPSIELSSKFFDSNLVTSYLHAPAATTPQIVTPDGGVTKKVVDLQPYMGFVVIATAAVLVGAGMTLVEIIASDDALGTVNVTQVKTSGVIGANVVGSKVVLECTSEEVAGLSSPAGFANRYLSARITMANASDKAIVQYIRTEPRFHRSLLTSNSVATPD